ncbi:lipopolysaccharide biosynthesis [Defluviimonas sp. WL0024]|uniref:Lipopolysaccharide biosynthesis n=1 Tax=Albidovulum salinarum TaxID=2984153 RepID=A0ABT2X218_9RHOB|nr:lipopolysaccharide biosynthesis [Defluviimonas sp. WL0024]MCU9847997.1 lipopolysaccharide biosynthesis [Defluviimonas sp. WL0024]
MNLDLSFYFAIFLRRLHYFIVIFALVTAASVAAALLLPPVYSSSALLLLEGSRIPDALAAPTVQAAAMEKFQTVENRLMTRANLIDIARRNQVFENVETMSPDQTADAMRGNTRINKSTGRGEATTMWIEFQGESGEIAAAVVGDYVQFILDYDLASRTASAESTLEFFENEVNRLDAELDRMSARILDFQQKNADALPSTLTFRLGQQTLLQGRLATIENDIATLKDQKARMIAIFQSTGQISNATTAGQTPEAQQLDALRSQLSDMLAVFAPSNPKVRVLQQKIAQLEEVVKAQLPGDGSANQAATMLDVQLADLDTRIALAEEQRAKLIDELAVLQDTIDRTPANQVVLDALVRDQANIQQQYDAAVARRSQAAAGERIQVLEQGERISLVETPTVPDGPVSPNRTLIVAGGMLAGIVLGIAVIVLLEVLNRSVRRPKDLIDRFGITPIVTIPYIRTPSETMRRRSGFAAVLLVAIVGIPAIIYAVHIYYQPLDAIFAKVAEKLGLSL